MKIHIILTLLCVVLLNSCHKAIDRMDVEATVLTEGLYMTMVGNFLCSDQHLILTPRNLSEEGFLHIFDQNGELIETIGNIGNGPNEFITPMSILYKENAIFTWDLNKKMQAIYSIDNNTGSFHQELISVPFLEGKTLTAIQSDINGNFITYDPCATDILTVYNAEGEILASSGKLPFPTGVANAISAYQGRIYYNRFNNLLLLCLSSLPYVALYEIKGSSITFLQEKMLRKKEYSVSDNMIHFDEYGKDCMVECCLTKDYIVSVKNDPDYKGSVHSRTSPKRNTVALYDFELNLVKIVNIHMSRYNLTSKGDDNSFYAIVQNPENSIVKVSL
ncbi:MULTISPECIES: 6-bladed beta-propeller [unclassified Parabacteroides]|uniref:6-bladed beta-propeller n=1 Tax=unclassified Parabacteroides TaxID=2649774 RepID=UPI002473E770|nr:MULTISPECIES: 6-bladed beta-propeller [unclassified Parabacteroides]